MLDIDDTDDMKEDEDVEEVKEVNYDEAPEVTDENMET